MNKPKLSIIILNYNTKELLKNCLDSIKKYRDEVPLEVVVSDNSSTDGSPQMVKEKFPWVTLLVGDNTSYSSGNNRARNIVKGELVLFLNSDTLIHKDTLKKTVEYLENNTEVGAVTCKLILGNGELDKDARRRFSTPWVSFNRLFLGRGGMYWYEDKPEDLTHEVDAIQGAYFLTRKALLNKVGWFDEHFIYDGEDLDLSFQIKKAGYKIIYYPEVSITHLKGATKGKIKDVAHVVDKSLKIKRRMEGVDSMEYFYKKNLWGSYPFFINYLVLTGIKILKLTRYIQAKLSN